MIDSNKGNIVKFGLNYLGFAAILVFVYIIYSIVAKKEYIYKKYPIKVEEISRFEYDNDTLIVLRIEYQEKDYITTKIKHKK
jgi:hypothetical protein